MSRIRTTLFAFRVDRYMDVIVFTGILFVIAFATMGIGLALPLPRRILLGAGLGFGLPIAFKFLDMFANAEVDPKTGLFTLGKKYRYWYLMSAPCGTVCVVMAVYYVFHL